MDKVTEIRRRINYLTDLIHKSDRVIAAESIVDYYEYYRNYQEVVAYLNSSQINNDEIPELIKPSIFNRRLGGLWTVTAIGIVNPFFAILFLTISFPISVPYLIVRGLTLRRTKDRVEDVKVWLTGIVNKLDEQRMEMTSS